MSFKAKFGTISAAFLLSAGMAQALTVDSVLQTYQDAGFSAIDVRQTASTIKVEAVKDGVKLELVYDKASGEVLKREQRVLAAGQTGSADVASGEADHANGSGDGSDHDVADDHGGRDQGRGNEAGDDHGDGDHGGADHGGADHAGTDQGDSDHSGGDDHGGDN